MLTILVFLIVTACVEKGAGDPGPTEALPSNGASADRVTLTFWRNAGNEAENKAYEQLVTTFMERNPSVAVEMKLIPYSDYETKLRTSVASGNAPDIMALDASSVASFAYAGALLPLTQYFRRDGHMDDIPPSTLATYTFQDEVYMAPLNESSIALFYNKRMFEAKGVPFPPGDPDQPWTWDQVLDAAIQLNDTDKEIYGIDPAQGFQNAGATAYFKYPIIWQFGGELMSPDGSTAKGYLDSFETKEAIRFYSALYNTYKVSALEYPPDPFPTGHLGMTIEGSWTLAYFAEKFPDFKLGEDYGIAPLPKQAVQAVANGSWALGISSKTRHADAAWEFVNWITGREGQVLYCSITKDIPARYSAAKEFPKLNQYPMSIFVVQNQKFGRPRPVTPIFPQMSEAIHQLFEDVVIGQQDLDGSIANAVVKIDRDYAQMLSRTR